MYKWVSRFKMPCVSHSVNGCELSGADLKAAWHGVLKTPWLICKKLSRLDGRENRKIVRW